MIKKNIEIICPIYKSVSFLNFIIQQILPYLGNQNGWNISFRIIANNATQEIINLLPSLVIPYTIYNDIIPNEYYINRVYRCYNYAVETSQYDNVCLINSDMSFSPNWLIRLLENHNGINIPCSRLVESGKMPSGKYGISKYFGNSPKNFRYDDWITFSSTVNSPTIESGGLFMPVIFEKRRFLESGGYPWGNIYETGIGTQIGNVIKSGDAFFFEDVLTKLYDMKHITVFDSLVYHFQEGEKSEGMIEK